MRLPRQSAMTHGADDRDEELDLLVRRGSVAAFAVLVERYSSAVYYMIYARVGDPRETERLVIEVFCAAWRDLRHPHRRHRGFLGVLSHAVAVSIARDEDFGDRNP